jgi:hydroxymethylpyrimidine kinase/phosphomethylpyrimidine kinase
MRLPVALTIAGSDSGGGAGIQADLKTFAALGVHGASAITAVTAQNTQGVSGYLEIALDMVRAQIDQVVADLAPAATKTGMLSSAEIIEVVATAVEELGIPNLVVDPVMVAKGGAKLLRDDAVSALRERLVPLAAVITPNLPEAEVLLGRALGGRQEWEPAARDLLAFGCSAVVIKGGHAEGGDAADLFFDGERMAWLEARRVPTSNTHGSGCTFSAAIAAGFARGLTPLQAVQGAKELVTAAIVHSLDIGQGHGPVNPLWCLPAGRRIE